jgi:hypothetical protein
MRSFANDISCLMCGAVKTRVLLDPAYAQRLIEEHETDARGARHNGEALSRRQKPVRNIADLDGVRLTTTQEWSLKYLARLRAEVTA